MLLMRTRISTQLLAYFDSAYQAGPILDEPLGADACL